MATNNVSLAARCTSCQTVFRVVPDQLRVSGGWVRCGRCAAVFNAGENLVELEDGVVRRSVRLPGPMVQTAEPDIDLSSRPQAFDASPAHEPAGVVATSDGALISAWPDTNVRDDTAFVVEPDTAAAPDAPAAAAAWALPPAADEPEQLALEIPARPLPPSQPAPVAPPAEPVREAPSPSSALPAPSFVRNADRAARWRLPQVRAALAVVALLAVAGLITQVLVEYRDLAAARWPVLQPLLVAFCDVAGCRVEPARSIDGLAVESSGLSRIERTDRYRLSVTLRNRAGIDLALPALDLSLTDTQGKLIARRVLPLAEIGASQATLAPGRELSLQATLRAAPGSNGEAVSGYTIELFYP
jgi:predicted Zn finger-like uncharacterized protein